LDGVRLATNGCKNREFIQNHKYARKKVGRQSGATRKP